MAMAPQLRDMAGLAHKYSVPVVANICGSGLQPAHVYYTNDAWWGAAMNAWNSGVDGIYTFNLFPVEPDERLSRIGSTETLKGLDKIYAIDAIEPKDFWGFDRAGLVVPNRLPITLVPNANATAMLPVGEDIAANTPEGKKATVRLRLRVSSAAEKDQLRVSLNGEDIGQAAPETALSPTPAVVWFSVTPPVEKIQAGDNVVEMRFATPRCGDDSVVVDRLELPVNYVAP